MTELYDAAVLGLGPSGTVAAHRAAQRGLRVLGIDPRGMNAPSTVGAWVSQIPDWFPEDAVASRFRPEVITSTTRHRLTAEYAILAEGWEQKLDGFDVVEEKAWPGVSVRYSLDGGAGRRRLRDWFRPNRDEHVSVLSENDAVPDQFSQLLVTVPQSVMGVRQLAHGVVVPESAIPEAERRGVLMDFSPITDFPHPGPVTFSYRVPLGDGTWLVEETILATSDDPEPLLEHLEEKNLARLRQLGIVADDIRRTEVVNFPMGPRGLPDDRPRTRLGVALGMIPFGKGVWLDLSFLARPFGGSGMVGESHIGTAGGWIHPATGYSVGDVLAGTDEMLDRVLADNRPTSTAWRVNYVLRRLGLGVLLGLSPAQYQQFFSTVLGLPETDLLNYLTNTNPWVTAGVMVKIILRQFRSHPPTALAVFRLVPGALARR